MIKIDNNELTSEVDSMTIPYLQLDDYYVKEQKNQVALGGNFFKDQLPISREDVETRLKRKHQKLKAAWYLGKDKFSDESF